ncbi:MAG: dTMP kinase [Anaerolineae bacterium]|nr:dTMP kinase [Anaerolineae bacterium]
MRGWFITFEGPDGSGKTTQLRLMAPWLMAQDMPVVVTREPGGTPVGERIRDILHDCAHTEMTAEAEILLYSASRAQHVGEIIRPAVAAGKIVLCDRFYDSTFAYQGYGRGLSLDALRQITTFATQGLVPDLTLYLDVPPDVGIARREASGEALNRLDREALAFHHRVRVGYLALIEAEPSRWRYVDATGTPDAIQETLREIVMATISPA